MSKVVAKQPVGNVYLIVVVPANLPVATPEIEVIDPMVGNVLLHVPPPVASVIVKVAPTHTLGEGGPMAAGFGFMVTTLVVVHPVAFKV